MYYGRGMKLREIIEKEHMIDVPGVYDALSAKLVQITGYHAAYFTGCGAHAAMLGLPDIDLLTMTELADQVRRICNAIDLPVIADAQHGFGDIANVIRTTQMYEDAGVAIVQLDDEKIPCKCPYLYPNGKQELVSIDEMCEKIHAASKARRDKGTIIMARSDTKGSVYDTGDDDTHIDEQIKRLRAYVDAGAEAVFPVVKSFKNYKRVHDEVNAPIRFCAVTPQVANEPGYDLHLHSREEYVNDMKCNIYMTSVMVLTANIKATKAALEYFKKTGQQPSAGNNPDDMTILLSDMNNLLRIPEYDTFKNGSTRINA